MPAPAPGDLTGPLALLDRLPARLGRDVVRLEAQQHYLRVVTTRGEHLLLHGMASAVAEMARRGTAGMLIHRSFWVAWGHVERLDLRPGSPAAVLRDGTRLPIGRRRIRDVAGAWHRWPGSPAG
ncbi:MAG: LytTR family DNA-binding domain-containing protein [Rubrivivax sp.]